jgi:DNA end-binding protein Ku
MAKTANPNIGLKATAGKRTLRFGLVNVGISMAPALDTTTRVAGKLLDPTLFTPVKQTWMNARGETVDRDTLVKGYAYGDSYVTLDPAEIPPAEGSDVIELVANLHERDVPLEWVEKTYLAWPTDTTHDAAYALVSHYLRSNGRVFIGTTVANGTTKAFAVRWSDTYGCAITQLLAYHGQVRWANVDTVKSAVAELPTPDPKMTDMAKTIFNDIPSEFAWNEVQDAYGAALEAAIREKAESGQVTAQPQGAPEPFTDTLMAALHASLSDQGPKPKAKRNTNKTPMA